MKTLQEIVEPLLAWYDKNKRVLPWRDQHNAYYTWISEIMLQQTRVEAVKPYFTRFVSELPDVAALADVPEERLLKLWEGLGYYSRARNLQAAAQQMMEQYDGKLPADHQALLSLKGIGRYTAGAIASIAYGIPVPAVDGNVLRVISRITESREDILKERVKRAVEALLQEIMPADRPGDFNQALMEIGAVVCVPNGAPHCEECPVQAFCKAHRNGTETELPVKTAKKPRTVEERTVFVLQDGSRTLIRKRPPKGLLAGLFELPNVLGHCTEEEALAYAKEMGFAPLRIRELPRAKHIFSHIEWQMKAYQIQVDSLTPNPNPDLLLVARQESQESYAIPSAFGAYVKYMKEE